ncbi:Membrane-bound lytic murein transglycosylase B [hydrothermal vent metagenome]|uniref:Membrane-bound lytic murein transglycosylase B n=1 Tax=hydrothermal vent metagenome TaxID=652676 RepID=A0A3B0RVH2_9ZZZZ
MKKLLISLFLVFATPVFADEPISFEAWREAFAAKAIAAGHDKTLVQTLLTGLTPHAKVLERDRYQPEFTRPIWQYLDSAVSDLRVQGGKQALADHTLLLRDLQETTGVPAEIITAIWGLESAYGKIQGSFDVVRALATLAHDGRRRNWAEGELLAVLSMLANGDASREQLKGAWAGAMGQTQFLPSTYLQYAVDGDGDGRKDIWGSETDALASTANYLSRHGWKPGQSWGVEIQVPHGFAYQLADDTVLSIGSWQVRGAEPANGRNWSEHELGQAARLLLPAGAGGPKILVGKNFRVIKRYNNSTAYALGVGLLAKALVNRPGLRATWPTDIQPLSRTQIQQMQELLLANGHDPGGVDGLAGPNTRRALRDYQQRIGLLADGFATQQVLQNLKVSQKP